MKRVLLLGAGHAHLHLAANAAAFHREGAELTLVDPGKFWYSGLATGMLGGMYEEEQDTLDPEILITRHGGRFVQGKAVALDLEAGKVLLENGEALGFDLLSLNLGSEPKLPLPGLAEHAWSVKPISLLQRLRSHLETRFQAGEALTLAVLGGGPTGCELAANLVALARRHGAQVRVRLVQDGPRLAPQFSARTGKALQRALEARGVEVLLNAKVTAVEKGRLHLEGGPPLTFDELIAATGLRAPAILQDFGLPLDAQGNLQVDSRLCAIGHPNIFGTGDCIQFKGRDLPKVGVFGVRQAPVLLHNLLATLRQEPLQAHTPQRRYLLILNLGDGEALAVRGRLHWKGRLSMRLKNYLDTKFLEQYRA